MKKLLSAVVVLGSMPALAANVDVAPFGRRLDTANSVGVRWGEMRRVARVELVFAEGAPVPGAEKLKVEYWHRVWNGSAVRRYVEQGAGGVGWAAMDDWYNGAWKTADVRAAVAGRTVAFTFAPSHEKEFPNLRQAGPVHRATLQVRVLLPGAHPKIAALHIFSDAVWQTSNLVIRFDKRKSCDDALEVYNGALLAKSAAPYPNGCALRATVRYAFNPEDADTDRTIVTVRSRENPFSFAVDEAERGDRIYVRDFDVLVTRASDPITIEEHRRSLQESGGKTIYERVGALPEQTLQRAWNDMPIKEPYYFILGCEGGRQRFRLMATGDIQMSWPSHPNGKGPNNTGLAWPNGIRLRFGMPETRFKDQFLAEGYLPIVTTRWIEGDLLYEQEAVAVPLAGNIESAPPMQADDPVAALLRFRIVNLSPEPRRAVLNFSLGEERTGRTVRPSEILRAEGARIMGPYQGRSALRYIVDTPAPGNLTNTDAGPAYAVELAGRQEHTFFVNVPFVTPAAEADIERLRALRFAGQRQQAANFWRRRVAAGSQIRMPEPWLNDFYKAALTHLLINSEREIGSDRYAARVGSTSYGAYGNESIMMISDLDRRGYWKEAERTLELFLHYQGSKALPGAFSSKVGVFNGAGGYEAGGYNQHHGWILWGLGEHWFHTRDRAWMERNAPKIVAGCRWIATERKATQRLDANGSRVPEYGLLPAGSLEDVTDYWFWISTNSFTWWGLKNAAAALTDFGSPEGAALSQEADQYGRDILTAYHEAAVRSPVVRLRDGTYIPKIPSNVYTRGRAYGWLRETLEGAIMLPITRLLDPASREALWILKDFEDNLYISENYGYSVPTFDRFWFSRGGFSMQPNLLHGPLPFFFRDDIKQFVRAYFNPFAAGFDPGLRLLPEHPLPELGYLGGQHFKTSDESQSNYWLRLMFVAELEGTLHLGRGIPRYWLKDGQSIGIDNASTYFGKTSYTMRSEAASGRISMSLEPPERNPPKQIVVRFRHPEEKAIRAVTVNGARWQDFDPKGDIRLPGSLRSKTEIVASY